MARAAAKHGAAAYWVPPFTLDRQTRKAISRLFDKTPNDKFFTALERATADFVSQIEYKRTAPRLANISTALGSLDISTRKLIDLLNETDGYTRQLIGHAWFLDGRSGMIIEDSERALLDLWTAVLLTRNSIQGKIPKGRPTDTKQGFVCQAWRIFEQFNLRPTANRNDPLESCISLLLIAAKAATGEENIHQLAMKAAKINGTNDRTFN
jgi:hypothetical protein